MSKYMASFAFSFELTHHLLSANSILLYHEFGAIAVGVHLARFVQLRELPSLLLIFLQVIDLVVKQILNHRSICSLQLV